MHHLDCNAEDLLHSSDNTAQCLWYKLSHSGHRAATVALYSFVATS